MMKKIECRGTPYQIGFAHGSGASQEIERGLAFYADAFARDSNQSWPQVQQIARSFDLEIRAKWPRYHQELQGIADGSKRDILDIVAMNVRSEIVFGMATDGCTSLFWDTPANVFLGQNWDWMEDQKRNLIILSIYQDSLPAIKMISEAGILGKIGLNAAGVGVCFNAILVRGLDASRMPVHLGLRSVLESNSTREAVARLEAAGMATSAHMLIGDGSGDSTGLEFTSSTFARLSKNDLGAIVHSNHLVAKHVGAKEPTLTDSPKRFVQMTEMTQKFHGKQPSWDDFSRLFEDQTGFPGAICRAQEGVSKTATLFNIVMDLKTKRGIVKLGRPCAVEEVIELSFD